MRSSSDRRGRVRPAIMRLGLVLTILLGYVIAAGCGSIQVTEALPPPPPPPSSSVSPAPNTGEHHDLSIIAVDFDPALDIERIINNQPISLLVGVENQGNRMENGVMVRATLYNGDRTRALMTDSERIPSLAAGNVKVLRFTHSEAPPRYDSYVLVVDIDAVPRESDTANNHRTLNITINGAH